MEPISEPSSIADQSNMPSRWEKGLRSPLTLGLVSCGAVGAFLFTLTYVLEGITRAGYDAWQQPISALSLGPGGWMQQVNFVVYGVLLMLSAVGWYRFLAPGRGAIWFPLLQGMSGLCLLCCRVPEIPLVAQRDSPGKLEGSMTTITHCIILERKSFAAW